MATFPVDECLKKLKLRRLTADENAGVAICSLPVPEGGPTHLSLAGRPTSVRNLGCWGDGSTPRRLLMTADMDNNAPEILSVTKESRSASQTKPDISMELFDTCPRSSLYVGAASRKNYLERQKHRPGYGHAHTG